MLREASEDGGRVIRSSQLRGPPACPAVPEMIALWIWSGQRRAEPYRAAPLGLAPIERFYEHVTTIFVRRRRRIKGERDAEMTGIGERCSREIRARAIGADRRRARDRAQTDQTGRREDGSERDRDGETHETEQRQIRPERRTEESETGERQGWVKNGDKPKPAERRSKSGQSVRGAPAHGDLLISADRLRLDENRARII